MTSDRIFNALAAYLKPKVEAEGGTFSPSETVAETLAFLGQSPGRWRCILQWQREDDTPNRNELQMKFLVIVQQGKGLPAQAGADVAKARAGDKSLLQRFNETAAWVRAACFTNQDIRREPIKQHNAQWVTDPAFPTRQISGEFSVFYGPSPVTLQALTA
jgi:hypothetical protein